MIVEEQAGNNLLVVGEDHRIPVVRNPVVDSLVGDIHGLVGHMGLVWGGEVSRWFVS